MCIKAQLTYFIQPTQLSIVKGVQDLAAHCYSLPNCSGFTFQPATKILPIASGWLKAGPIDTNCTSVSPNLTTYALSTSRPIAPLMPVPSSEDNVGAIAGGELALQDTGIFCHALHLLHQIMNHMPFQDGAP